MPDWIVRTLAILNALSGWVFLALAIALGVFLFAPTPAGIDLELIRQNWGGWLYLGLVVFGFLALARFAQWVAGTVRSAIRQRREGIDREAELENEQQQQEEHRETVLGHLDTLSSEERDVLKYLVENNQRTAVGSMVSGALHTLYTKGLLEVAPGILTPLQASHTVPDFVWDALIERSDELFGANS